MPYRIAQKSGGRLSEEVRNCKNSLYSDCIIFIVQTLVVLIAISLCSTMLELQICALDYPGVGLPA